MEPGFEEECEKEPEIRRLLEIALKLEGLYRNTSTHAAGVVIGATPLDQIVPVYKDPSSDMPVTQFDMKFVEDASLIKYDFLGLKTLTVLKKAVDLIALKGIRVDLGQLPLDDKETYDLLSRADTSGVFQLESTGLRKVLRDMKPDKMEDLIAIVSLYRPGPMDNIPSYINRKFGREEPDYLNPLLEGILKETYGIMIYQEQVMQIAQVLAGYSLGGADLLRRAMGKKKKEIMAEQKILFIEGAKKNGVEEENARMIFEKMEKFASYGFNKSHAAAYALVAYQTAYLKAHYPVEFMAATMTLDSQNTDKLGFFKREVAKMGIKILPPDINKSNVFFSVENGAIRYALAAVKNVGEGAMETVVKERNENGPYKSVPDFLSRVDVSAVNKRSLEFLIKAGAFDSLDKDRAKLFANLEKMVQFATAAQEQRKSSQISLFGEQTVLSDFKMEPAAPWHNLEKLNMESTAIGFYLSAHPLDVFEGAFDKLQISSYAQVTRTVRLAGTTTVKMAGILISIREKISQKTGNKFAFVSVSDTTGSYDMICFSELYAQSKEKLKSGRPLLFSVRADRAESEEDGPRLMLLSVDYLEEAQAQAADTMMVYFEKKEAVPHLKTLLEGYKGGRGKVILVAQVPHFDVEMKLPGTYHFSAQMMSDLQDVPEVTEIR